MMPYTVFTAVVEHLLGYYDFDHGVSVAEFLSCVRLPSSIYFLLKKNDPKP